MNHRILKKRVKRNTDHTKSATDSGFSAEKSHGCLLSPAESARWTTASDSFLNLTRDGRMSRPASRPSVMPIKLYHDRDSGSNSQNLNVVLTESRRVGQVDDGQ
jgi:hypothetical protein